MHQPEQLFTRFNADIEGIELPNAFTFPFYYQLTRFVSLPPKSYNSTLLSNQIGSTTLAVKTIQPALGKCLVYFWYALRKANSVI
ncbi:hypothetical protein JCM19238_4961 [Vibrio ponticus]|nr:hypothetical protein JCM19238_4961 [Vibrio ponticus]